MSTHPATAAPRAPIAHTVLELVERSRASLLAACHAHGAGERYVDAHLGALRAAAALLAARSTPTARSRPRSVWEVLPGIAPDLTEWASFFAGSARRRAALTRGSATATSREADDLLRQAEVFLELVQGHLGLPISTPLPQFIPPTAPEHLPATPRRDGRTGGTRQERQEHGE